MKTLSILFANNKKLKAKNKAIARFDEKLQALAAAMVNTLRKNKGMGLAAPQVGENLKLLVAEYQPKKNEKLGLIPLTILVNPEITKLGTEQEELLEGCLSFPALELPITRPKKMEIKAQNLFGKKIKIKASDLFSRVLQHEIDHLDGILISERTTNKKMIPANLRVCFLGEGEFAKPIRERLEQVGYQIVEQNNNPDLIVVANFGRILTKEELEKPAFGCLNIHPSLLPKYRGPSPIQTVLLNNEKETGVTIFKMDEMIDHGPLLSQMKIKIKNNDDYNSLSKKLTKLAADLIIKTIPLYTSEQIKPKEQNHELATHTKKINKTDAEIDWTQTALKIHNQIRAYVGWPVAYTILDGKRFLIYKTRLDNEKLVLDEVQLEGKKQMKFEEFKRGYRRDLTLPKFVI